MLLALEQFWAVDNLHARFEYRSYHSGGAMNFSQVGLTSATAFKADRRVSPRCSNRLNSLTTARIWVESVRCFPCNTSSRVLFKC